MFCWLLMLGLLVAVRFLWVCDFVTVFFSVCLFDLIAVGLDGLIY